MAEYFRGQPPVRFIPNGRLIDFLQAILAGLDVQQTVGDVFTPERLVELGTELDLADWGQLYCMTRGLKESRPKSLSVAGLERSRTARRAEEGLVHSYGPIRKN
jgi:hypothetical protein